MSIGCKTEDAFDQVAGLSPTVASGQAAVRQSNPRSVVGTQILTCLGLFYARDGRMPCPVCGTAVRGADGLRCPSCGHIEPPLQANPFSFSSPSGVCLHCQGRGLEYELHMDRLVPDDQITLRGVLERVGAASAFGYLLRGKLKPYADRPFAQLPEDARTHILYGVETRGSSRHHSHNLFRVLARRPRAGQDVARVLTVSACPACGGYRVGLGYLALYRPLPSLSGGQW